MGFAEEREEDWTIGQERCAFCGRGIEDVEKLIRSPDSDIYICDICAKIVFNLSDDTINHKSARKRREELAKAIISTRAVKKEPAATPSEIHREMDRFIIGQERANKTLSVAVYNHGKRLRDRSGLIKKSNILLVGPTGCGKTLIAKTISRILDVPFATVDATSLTETGYVGDDVEICLQRLLEASGGDTELAQKSIVFIDEIDKISFKEPGGRDVGGGAVQAALLKLVEGSKVSVPVNGNRRNPKANYVTIDTTDILFICGGAFDGLMDSRKDEKHNIGFAAGGSQPDLAKESLVSTEDLIKYGMMPEFIGRFPVVCTLDVLKKEDLIRILAEPEDAITKEYELLLKKDGVRLVFELEALEEIAGIAIKRNTGARGLRSIIEEIMLEIMYDLPGRSDISKCVITADTVNTKQPVYVKKRVRKQTNSRADASI